MGYNTSESRGADTFHPFKGTPKLVYNMSGSTATTLTYTATKKSIVAFYVYHFQTAGMIFSVDGTEYYNHGTVSVTPDVNKNFPNEITYFVQYMEVPKGTYTFTTATSAYGVPYGIWVWN